MRFNIFSQHNQTRNTDTRELSLAELSQLHGGHGKCCYEYNHKKQNHCYKKQDYCDYDYVCCYYYY